ncbi:hypothetical protein PQX77_006805 [Marasmius sp. AFHP31]|nr:hypothetical protein PQX77_006805 [Marasmius sp. AFHP31]
MGYIVYVSDKINREQPCLIPLLNNLFTAHSKESVTISIVPALLPHIRSVEFDDDSGSLRGRLKMIWLDGQELLEYMANATLGQLIEDFRDYHAQDGPSQRTLLLVHRPPPARRMEIEIEMCRRVLQSSSLYHIAETLEEVAAIIFSYMCGFWEMIANPTAAELREDYRNMLLVLPSMTPERADLVIHRYSCWRHLMEAFERLEPRVQSGEVALNSALFSSPTDHLSNAEEHWVRELYHFITANDPDMPI